MEIVILVICGICLLVGYFAGTVMQGLAQLDAEDHGAVTYTRTAGTSRVRNIEVTQNSYTDLDDIPDLSHR